MLVMLGMSAMAEDIIWQEDWSGVTEFNADPSNFNANYTFTGSVLNADGTVKSGTKFYNEKLAGGEAPELLIAKNGGSFAAKVAMNGKSGEMMLSFKCNRKDLTVTAEGAELGAVTATGNDYVYPVTVAAGTEYVTITFTQNASSNARLDNIKLYQGTAKKPAGLSWGKASTVLTIGQSFTLVLSNENQLPVTYTSSDESVATISAEGVITLVAAGKTVLTAAFAGNDEYEAQTVSIEVTVKEEEEQPEVKKVTVAEALSIINALEPAAVTADTYQIEGYVISFDEAFNPQYGNYTLNLGDTQDATATLKVFRAKNADNQKFTEDIIKVGDKIVVEGKLQNYVKNGETIPETYNAIILSVEGKSTSSGISVVKAQNGFNGAIYNLKGQRVKVAGKGLFIMNGKKVFVK